MVNSDENERGGSEDATSTRPNNSTGDGTPSTTPSFPQADNNKWGYDLYPERRGKSHELNWFRAFLMLEGRESMEKARCEKNVYTCVSEINIRRHISCEFCEKTVSGGYDPELNQIVVCQNTSKTQKIVQGVLVHEMIHMFDFCRNNLDFKNIDHLACTEIRAANLTHCSFLSALSQGDASFFNIKKTHQKCVKQKAVHSIMTVRNITYEQAVEAVERTFPKCYPDMEPIGRRPRSRSNDGFKAYYEAPLYGYDV